MQWFTVNKDGLGKLLAARGPEFIGRELVVDRIIHLDDLAIYVEGIGDIHILAHHQTAKGTGNTGFTITGRAI